LEDLIINFAPTGMIPTKEMTPFVPITELEIIDEVFMAWELGITMVHIHARNPKTGEPTNKIATYAKIIEGIRSFTKELIICVSLSGRTLKEYRDRAAPLDLDGEIKPDMGSLTLSSLNFNKQASINEPKMIRDLALKMRERRILPELEAFDAGMINYSKYLIRKNIISPPYYFNLIFGNIACAQADLMHAGVMLNDLPENSFWSFGGVGDYQLMMNNIAIVCNGGVRVGLEDNIYFDINRKKLAKNIDMIKRIHSIAETHERKIMSPSKLRKLLDLEKGNGKYGKKQPWESQKKHNVHLGKGDLHLSSNKPIS
jgi:3-keto-5-aminohexanoate cleavage enzyme